jgi:hypothetical protein
LIGTEKCTSLQYLLNNYGRKRFIVLAISEALAASPSIKKSEKIKFSFFLSLLSVGLAIAFLLLFQVKNNDIQ